MLRTIFSLFFAFMFLTTQAHAATHKGLKAAFDEFNFALSVQGAEVDPALRSTETKKFTQSIRALMAQGLSNTELIDFAVSSIKDKNVAQEIRNAVSLVHINLLSADEAIEIVEKSVARSYRQGASWSGDPLLRLTGVIVLFLVVVMVVQSTASNPDGSGDVQVDPNAPWCYDEDCTYAPPEDGQFTGRWNCETFYVPCDRVSAD